MAESKSNADGPDSDDEESNISGHFRRSKTAGASEDRNKLIVDDQLKEHAGSKFVVSQKHADS